MKTLAEMVHDPQHYNVVMVYGDFCYGEASDTGTKLNFFFFVYPTNGKDTAPKWWRTELGATKNYWDTKPIKGLPWRKVVKAFRSHPLLKKYRQYSKEKLRYHIDYPRHSIEGVDEVSRIKFFETDTGRKPEHQRVWLVIDPDGKSHQELGPQF